MALDTRDAWNEGEVMLRTCGSGDISFLFYYDI